MPTTNLAARSSGPVPSGPEISLPIRVHGHFVNSGIVVFVGRSNRYKTIFVTYKGNGTVYGYYLGEAYNPGICCLLARQPSVGSAIATHIKRYPFKIVVR